MLKCWADFQGYDEFVRTTWGSFHFHGCRGYVLRKKLKLMKLSLKEWHQQHTQNLNGKMVLVKNHISFLEEKGEMSVLPDDDIAELHDLSINLHSLARAQASLSWQNSRMKWLQEGDANSKFFHGVMSARRRHNSIHMVSVGCTIVEGVPNIRATVFEPFSNHFKVVREARPSMGGSNFRQISSIEADNLTKPFSLEEVKRAVWDFDGSKSPGPDSISFDFIKKN